MDSKEYKSLRVGERVVTNYSFKHLPRFLRGKCFVIKEILPFLSQDEKDCIRIKVDTDQELLLVNKIYVDKLDVSHYCEHCPSSNMSKDMSDWLMD